MENQYLLGCSACSIPASSVRLYFSGLRRIPFLIFFILLPVLSFTQANLDSLWAVWEDQTKSDSIRLDAFHEYGSVGYSASQPDSAIYFMDMLYATADSLGLLHFESLALGSKGNAYRIKNDFGKAKKYLEEALGLAKEIDNKALMGGHYNTLGVVYRSENDFVKSAEFHTLSLRAFDEAPQNGLTIIGKANTLGGLGVVYDMQGDTSKARYYYEESLSLSKSVNDIRGEASQLSNIGRQYFYRGDFQKAMPYYQEAYALHVKGGHLQNSLITLYNIGNLHGAKGELKQALEIFKKGRKEAEKLGDEETLSGFISSIGSVYDSMGDNDLAIKYNKEAKKYAKESGTFDALFGIGSNLYILYKQGGDYKNALKEFEYITEIRDSIKSEETQRATLRQEYQYNYDKQALADSLAFAQKEAITSLELEKNQATLSQQRLGLIATILGLLLVAALAYFFYQSKKRQELEANRIKEVDAFKSTFYTNITHEFRTPLTVILGMVQQIKEQPNKFLEEGTELIERNGKNLLSQINQILDLSKLETNSLQVNMVQSDVVEFLRYSTEAFQSFANGQNLSLRFFSPVEKLLMDYDPESLQNIMSNLISNAMKFTPDGGDVKVALKNTEEQIIIKVEDTGAGISEKDLPHIFDRFYQVENKEGQNANGTGIGLAYVRELVKMLEGNISVESELGKGTSFAVALPIRNEAALMEDTFSKKENLNWIPSQTRVDKIGATRTTIEQSPVSNESLPQLLLIEDNADVVIYLKSCLSDLYQIDVAYNGRIGIEKALENIPDLIISDVMMPDKDGFEVCDTLKNDERTSHIPLILLTAKADAASKLAGLKRGADAYLSKPFDKEELLVRLEMLVERQKRMVSYFSKNEEGRLSESVAVEIIEIEDVFIKKINTILEENISDEDFGLPQLCQKVRMSRSQLFRKMKALTETAPSAFIKSYRLNKAKHLLESTEMNVAEAAYEVGFKDPSYFSKIFQEEFGQSPSMIKE